MAEKKITKRERFEQIKALIADNEELVKFIDHEIELLARKGSKSAKLTPAQEDALKVADIIKDILAGCEDNKGMPVGALLKDERIKSFVKADGNGVSSQMLTAILSKSTLSDKCPNGEYIRTVEKKTAYYSLNYGIEGEGEGE